MSHQISDRTPDLESVPDTADGSPWLSILERPGGGDRETVVDERRFEEQRLWQASLARRDDAIAHLELVRAGELPPLRSSPPIPPLGPIDDEEVRYSAETGRWIQEFEYYPPVKRWIARRVSKIMLYLTSFITVHQRRYNHLVLDRMTLLQERLDEVIERLAVLEGVSEEASPDLDPSDGPSSRDLEGAGVEQLRREIERLRLEVLAQAVEVADLQAERVGRRLTDLEPLKED